MIIGCPPSYQTRFMLSPSSTQTDSLPNLLLCRLQINIRTFQYILTAAAILVFSTAYAQDDSPWHKEFGISSCNLLTTGRNQIAYQTSFFAFGSGDDPNTGTNTEFRQTGLQSNEARFAGVSEFKTYGEALDPELSNLKILTVGLGFRPAPDVSLDFVYHHYWLDELADEIRNSALTAQMNQVDTRLSKDVGNAFDVVLGVRSLFGVRRLGLDLRAGWFFPGSAFLRNDGDEVNPNLRDAEDGFGIVTKFWW